MSNLLLYFPYPWGYVILLCCDTLVTGQGSTLLPAGLALVVSSSKFHDGHLSLLLQEAVANQTNTIIM